MRAVREEALIDEVQQRLVRKCAALTPRHGSAAIESALERFAQSTVRDFVPLLVERRASAEPSKHTALGG